MVIIDETLSLVFGGVKVIEKVVSRPPLTEVSGEVVISKFVVLLLVTEDTFKGKQPKLFIVYTLVIGIKECLAPKSVLLTSEGLLRLSSYICFVSPTTFISGGSSVPC